jgi:hypothetical protein
MQLFLEGFCLSKPLHCRVLLVLADLIKWVIKKYYDRHHGLGDYYTQCLSRL